MSVVQMSSPIFIYRGENNYFIPCWFSKFSHLKKKGYHFDGRFILLIENIKHYKKYFILVSIWSPTNQQELCLPQICFVHMWNTD